MLPEAVAEALYADGRPTGALSLAARDRPSV
jgi:hypothetical protein